MPTRYSKTTTVRRGNTTYRKTQSRSGYWGPYQTPEDHKANVIGIVLIMGTFLAVMWPWDRQIKGWPDTVRILLSIVCGLVLLLLLAAFVNGRKRVSGLKVKGPTSQEALALKAEEEAHQARTMALELQGSGFEDQARKANAVADHFEEIANTARKDR
jgi:hypothetical protein